MASLTLITRSVGTSQNTRPPSLVDAEFKWPREFNTLRPRQDGRHFADDIFKYIFLNENVWFPIKISLKFLPKRLFKNIPALVQIMAWRRSGDKPLSVPGMVSLPTHICVIRPQWDKCHWTYSKYAIYVGRSPFISKHRKQHSECQSTGFKDWFESLVYWHMFLGHKAHITPRIFNMIVVTLLLLLKSLQS